MRLDACLVPFHPPYACRLRFPAALLVLTLAALLVAPASADNPLKKKTQRPFAGKFTGESLALELTYAGAKAEYTGWLEVDGQRYACLGDVKEGVLQGTFQDRQRATYHFTARLDGDRMTLSSEGEQHLLRRQAGESGPNPPQTPQPESEPAPAPEAEPRPSPAPSGALGGVGIAFQETAEGWLVAQIKPGGPADRAHVEPGGRLRGVDGESVDGLSHEELRQRLQGPIGSRVTLELETADELLTVILERAALTGTPGGAGGSPPSPAPPAPGRTPAPSAPARPPTQPTAEGDLRLEAGVRVIWYQSSASIPGSRAQLVPDSDGDWVDPNTGQKFAEAEVRGAGGSGYSVVDIVTVTPEKLVVDGSLWTIDVTNQNAPSFLDGTGYVGDAQGLGELWVPPPKLAAMVETQGGAVRVRRMAYPLNGTTWNALRIQTQTGNGWTQYTYDRESGLLLVSGSSSVGAALTTPGAGGRAAQGAGSTHLTHGHLVSVRRTRLPGPGAVYPEAVRRVRRWTYSGHYQTQLEGMGDVQVPPRPVTSTFDILKADPSYLHAQVRGAQHQEMPALPPTERMLPAGVVGSVWMDPRVLGSLQPEQVLDEDPTLEARLVVAAVARGDAQGSRVILLRRCRAGSQSWVYDLTSGLLIAAEVQQQNGLALITASVQLTGRD